MSLNFFTKSSLSNSNSSICRVCVYYSIKEPKAFEFYSLSLQMSHKLSETVSVSVLQIAQWAQCLEHLLLGKGTRTLHCRFLKKSGGNSFMKNVCFLFLCEEERIHSQTIIAGKYISIKSLHVYVILRFGDNL